MSEQVKGYQDEHEGKAENPSIVPEIDDRNPSAVVGIDNSIPAPPPEDGVVPSSALLGGPSLLSQAEDDHQPERSQSPPIVDIVGHSST